MRINTYRQMGIVSPVKVLLATLTFGALPFAVEAQFTDTFGTIDPAWTADRYPPAEFKSVVFDGDSRLCLTIDQTGSTANRPAEYSSEFYAFQGCQRPGGITGPWTLSAQVFVSSAFNTATGPLACGNLWGHTGTTPAGGDYMILGFNNASPTDPFNPAAADRAFRFEAYDTNTAGWIDLGVPAGFVFDAWHTLSGTSTGASFEFRIDGALVLTIPAAGGNDLLTVFIEGYNFDQTSSYSIYWDNLTAGAAPIVAPTISNNPLTAAGSVGVPFTFTVTASGMPTSFAASALPDGLVLNAGSGAITGTPAAAGVTAVTLAATNADGTGSPVTLTITIAAVGVVPIITSPITAFGTVGTIFATYLITASGLPVSYAAGGLPPGLAINQLTGAIDGTPTTAGIYAATIAALNSAGTGTSILNMVIAPRPSSRLKNLSARAFAGAGANVLIVGFTVGGSGSKSILLRGVGPALAAFGVTGALTNPELTLYDSASASIATNIGWGNATTRGPSSVSVSIGPATAAIMNGAGAFALPAGSADCAIAASLPTVPSGSYSAMVAGANGATGVAMAEIYDADTSAPETRLVNVSARAFAGTGDNVLIAGFVIVGTAPETVLLRGVGPALAGFGVTGVLANPRLTLYDSASSPIATDIGWGNAATPGSSTVSASIGPATAAIMSGAGAFALPAGSADCAMVATLQPGAYTVEISGVNNSTGVSLIEVYEITPAAQTGTQLK
jgi:hypothetical protein